jgi:hypothetical protein
VDEYAADHVAAFQEGSSDYMYFWEHLKQEGVTLSQMMTMIKMRGLVLVMEILMKKMRCFLTPEIHSRA